MVDILELYGIDVQKYREYIKDNDISVEELHELTQEEKERDLKEFGFDYPPKPEYVRREVKTLGDYLDFASDKDQIDRILTCLYDSGIDINSGYSRDLFSIY